MTREELQTELDNERQRADNAVDLSYELLNEIDKLVEKISALESTLEEIDDLTLGVKMTDNEATKIFNEYLDEIYYNGIGVCGYTYQASDIFKAVDPIAYRQEYLNWLDAENIEVEQ